MAMAMGRDIHFAFPRRHGAGSHGRWFGWLLAQDEQATALRDVHLPGIEALGPIADEPGRLMIGKAGGHHDQHCASTDAVWPSSSS